MSTSSFVWEVQLGGSIRNMTRPEIAEVEQYHFRRRLKQESDPIRITRNYYWWRLRRNIIAALRRSPVTSGLVVDVGTGHGVATCLAYETLGPGFTYLATDLSAMDLAVAEMIFQSRKIPVTTKVADASVGLPVKNGEASVVLCAEVLEHIHEPGTLLAEISRIVRTGGIAVFTTPNGCNPLVRFFKVSVPQQKDLSCQPESGCGFGHVSVLGRREWKRHFKKAGFEVVCVFRGALLFGGKIGSEHLLLLDYISYWMLF